MLIIIALLMNSASAYEMGDAPFCKMDNTGNLQCYYYTMSACKDATVYDENSSCTRKSK